MNLKILVVDDELPAREELKCILEEIGDIEIVGECEDGEEVATAIAETTPNVIFLDIQMRSQNGLLTAGNLLNMEYPPHVIFCTGFSEYAAKAFELNAVDYILKPYSINRVRSALTKVRNTYERAQTLPIAIHRADKICVWSNDRIIVLHPNKIFFAKADKKRQTLLFTDQGNYYSKLTLKDLEKILIKHRFFRTHKSYLVNIEKIREIIPWFNNTYVLVLENCNEINIPVARHYLKEFNQTMGIS
jgi:DNA-binding LytR/AlgR family response regulator